MINEKKIILEAQFQIISAIRSFFNLKDFQDVLTPPMVLNPGMETHIHPFRISKAINSQLTDFYLHTSPEFHMKELLSLGFENIFTIGYSFRDEPISKNHRPQFLMLEWYRAHSHYEKIMSDCEELFQFSLEFLKNKNIAIDKNMQNTKYQKATIDEIFKEILNINILDYLETSELKLLIEKNFKDVPLPTKGETLSWDDYYFLLFLNKIEPILVNYNYLLLYEFPYHLSALSTIKSTDSRVCERFEIYSKGIEICNCFNELTSFEIQKRRFDQQKFEKSNLYNYSLNEPEVLYNALKKGIPNSSGIALGVERFLKVLSPLKSTFWDPS